MALPAPLRAGLERQADLDLSSVRVHYESPLPARLDALAFTQGPHIHLGPGQRDQLPHEGWHAVQQMQRRVAPTLHAGSVAINDDPALEREADLMGTRAAAGRPARSGVAGLARRATGPAGAPVQRAIETWNAVTNAWENRTDAAGLYDEMRQWIDNTCTDDELIAQFNDVARDELIGYMEQMMEPPNVLGNLFFEAVGEDTARERRTYRYRTTEDAVRAILAETYRAEATATEERLAREVVASDTVLAYVRTYAAKLWNYVTNTVPGYAAHMIGGEYKYYYQTAETLFWGALGYEQRTLMDVLRVAGQSNLTELISALHDAATVFFTLGQSGQAAAGAVVNVPAPQRVATGHPQSIFEIGVQATIDQVRPTLGGKSYIDETNPVVQRIRSAKALIEVGPSYTTGRFMQMGTTIGATPQEQVAIGLAIFAFWNQGYWKSTSGIHRFHFTMDMVQNYVPACPYEGAYPGSALEMIP